MLKENKLGIKGPSTRQIFFNDVVVPIENLLCQREEGFKIALNILNIGRIKLGAGVLGGCRAVISNSIQKSKYGQELWRVFLYLIIVLIIIEMILSNGKKFQEN